MYGLTNEFLGTTLLVVLNFAIDEIYESFVEDGQQCCFGKSNADQALCAIMCQSTIRSILAINNNVENVQPRKSSIRCGAGNLLTLFVGNIRC